MKRLAAVSGCFAWRQVRRKRRRILQLSCWG